MSRLISDYDLKFWNQAMSREWKPNRSFFHADFDCYSSLLINFVIVSKLEYSDAIWWTRITDKEMGCGLSWDPSHFLSSGMGRLPISIPKTISFVHWRWRTANQLKTGLAWARYPNFAHYSTIMKTVCAVVKEYVNIFATCAFTNSQPLNRFTLSRNLMNARLIFRMFSLHYIPRLI